MHEMTAGGSVNDSSKLKNITYQPSQYPTKLFVGSSFSNTTTEYHPGTSYIGKVNSSIILNNTLSDIAEPAMNQRLSQRNESSIWASREQNVTSNLNNTTIFMNTSDFSKIFSSSNDSSPPSNWYDYWQSSSKPTMMPTQHPSQEPTIEPTSELLDIPTNAPSQQARTNVTSSKNQNYEMISSMTAFISIIIVAAAFYMTKRHLLARKKTKNKIVIKSPFFSDMSKRVKQRKKLMEEYFEVDAAEGNVLHRSAASSIDLQISTEFIDITRENQHNQRAIY